MTDAALATVVKHMHQLTILDLCHCNGMSKAGVALLQQLPLRLLKLCGPKDLTDEVDEDGLPGLLPFLLSKQLPIQRWCVMQHASLEAAWPVLLAC